VLQSAQKRALTGVGLGFGALEAEAGSFVLERVDLALF
jgi:hypothetical protein